MIRRDYVLRQVQELVQVVARVLFLRQRREYDAALAEVGRALRQLDGDPASGKAASPVTGPDGWIELCRQNEAVTGNLLVVVGDLIREQGMVMADLGRPADATGCCTTALTLYLEAILSGAVTVTRELVDRVDQLIDFTADATMPASTLSRLAKYLEQRRRFAQAEDALFEWMESGEAEAVAESRDFYQRLLGRPDNELEEGELPRAEVIQGLAEVEARAAQPRSSGPAKVL